MLKSPAMFGRQNMVIRSYVNLPDADNLKIYLKVFLTLEDQI
jgi:hypothetical protein